MTDDLVMFLTARLDEDEARVKGHLCICCGRPTAPLRNAIGITGYTHDSWDPESETHSGWQGQRCPNRLTGAEPVQNPDRALREVEAKRQILAAYVGFRKECEIQRDASGSVGPEVWSATRQLGQAVRQLTAVYSDHPDYRQEWKP